MRKLDQEVSVQSERSVSLIKLIFLYQALPSLLVFYFLWPRLYTWQLEGSLSKVDPVVQRQLEKQRSSFAETVTILTVKSITETVSSICETLECVLSENKSVAVSQQSHIESKHILQMTVGLDIYDIPIVLEAMRRVPRTMILNSLEVHQYDRSAKLMLRYGYYNPQISELDWLGDLGLSADHITLLQGASKVHLWKDFIREEKKRQVSENTKQRLIRPELAQQLIKLQKQKGVLMYRSSKGFTFMPLMQD